MDFITLLKPRKQSKTPLKKKTKQGQSSSCNILQVNRYYNNNNVQHAERTERYEIIGTIR